MLGHTRPQITQQFYINRHADIDLQNSFVNRSAPSQRANAEKLRTMGSQRFIGAPVDLRGTAQYHAILQTPSVLTLRHEWEHLKTILASKEDVKKAKAQMDIEIARLRREGGREFRAEWVLAERSKAMEGPDEPEQLLESAENKPQLLFWRARVDGLLYETPSWTQEERLALLEAYRDLFNVGWNKYRCPHQDCLTTKRRFSNRDDFEKHAEGHSYQCPQTFRCRRERIVFKTKEELEEHKCGHKRGYDTRDRHDSRPKPQWLCSFGSCPRLKYPFPNERDRDRHFQRCHGLLTFRCSFSSCPRAKKPFVNLKSCTRHMKEVHRVEVKKASHHR